MSDVQHEWVRGDEVCEEQVEWLWPGRIPLGEYTLIGGNSSVGKSFISLYVAAKVTQGAQ